MSIVFTNKATLAGFIESAVTNAEKYLEKPPALIPHNYSRYAFLNKIIQILEPPFNRITRLLTSLFTMHQARAATERWNSSLQHQSAAFNLKHNYHKLLIRIDNPIAKVSEKILSLAVYVKEIDAMRQREANNYSNCGIFGLLGVVALSIGGYATSEGYTSALWFKKTGIIVLAATAVFYGYTWFSHRGDEQQISELWVKVGRLGEEIRYDLRYYTENMQLQVNPAENYQPLFKNFDTQYQPAAPENLPEIDYPIPKEQPAK